MIENEYCPVCEYNRRHGKGPCGKHQDVDEELADLFKKFGGTQCRIASETVSRLSHKATSSLTRWNSQLRGRKKLTTTKLGGFYDGTPLQAGGSRERGNEMLDTRGMAGLFLLEKGHTMQSKPVPIATVQDYLEEFVNSLSREKKKRVMISPGKNNPHEWCPECVGCCDEVAAAPSVEQKGIEK